jgi:RNA recognition motif-containing protein
MRNSNEMMMNKHNKSHQHVDEENDITSRKTTEEKSIPNTPWAVKIVNIPKTFDKLELKNLFEKYSPVKAEVSAVKTSKMKPGISGNKHSQLQLQDENGGWGIVWFNSNESKEKAKFEMSSLFSTLYSTLGMKVEEAIELDYREISRATLDPAMLSKDYVCNRCGIPGHYIAKCPTNNDPNFDSRNAKRPSGIPVSLLSKPVTYHGNK